MGHGIMFPMRQLLIFLLTIEVLVAFGCMIYFGKRM